MKFNYKAYAGIKNDNNIIEEMLKEDRTKKIKEPVYVEILIELDRSKYETIRKKYKTPIGEKIIKLFGF